MAETKKELLESLKKELSIRKEIVRCNKRFCREIAWKIKVLEGINHADNE
jgi:hypothetical protein